MEGLGGKENKRQVCLSLQRPVKTSGADEKARPPESSLAIRGSHRGSLPRVERQHHRRACDSVTLPLWPALSGDTLEEPGPGRGGGRKPGNTTGEVKKSKAIVLISPLITKMRDGERRFLGGMAGSSEGQRLWPHPWSSLMNSKAVPTLGKLKALLISAYFVGFYMSRDEFYFI